MLENLAKAGVQQSGRADAISFTSLTPWPGEWISAEGRYMEGDPDAGSGVERRAAIFIGPEYGTVQRADLVACAREAADAGFDIVIACAFNFDAHTAESSSPAPSTSTPTRPSSASWAACRSCKPA